ncbi:MAG: DUF4846 domain-containing protein [Bacteroidota bacterium]
MVATASSCAEPQAAAVEPLVSVEASAIEEPPTIVQEITTPNGFVREGSTTGFGTYLRQLPLKSPGSLVEYYNGDTKPNYGVYEYVVDLEIGPRDLHQCADAVMRVRAEYLWQSKQYDKIHFNFTNGFRVDYAKWMAGQRVIIEGNKTYWRKRTSPANTYASFWKYLELIFAYAGTASLEKELVAKPITEAQIGDVLIKGGFPGHAVIIVDKAVHPDTKEPIYLLAQSYMPAQQIQILQNPNDEDFSPWFSLKEGAINTPEWRFDSGQLKAFVEE